MTKILLVEDDKTIVMGLAYSLEQEGFEVYTAGNVSAALTALKQNYDLILLDLTLPDGTGYDVCRAVKGKGDTPVIFLTACDDEGNVVMGLDMGADDYITKPYNPLELVARVKSQLRRYTRLGNDRNQTASAILRTGGLELNTDTKQLTVDGEFVKLTPIEYRITELLMRNQNRVFSIGEIYEQVWQEPCYNVDNIVAVHIRRIREKIEINPKEPRYLKVVWGIGYKIESR